jgi:epoxyqueuosine reductase
MSSDPKQLVSSIKSTAHALGFAAVGISNTGLAEDEQHLNEWLKLGRHGDMGYMAHHGVKRSRPHELVPGTLRVISVRMDYLPEHAAHMESVLEDSSLGYISRYALGRDYHKLMRRRLQRLADQLVDQIGPFGYRVFVDSAPVLEKALARNAGLGWIGKHTNLLSKRAGSWFFLGELFTDLPLPVDSPASNHCGSCSACIDVCPTDAIVAPYQLDARRCIAYLTIEHQGDIPEPMRKPLGNRIYGCDDCQLVCPWNKFAQATVEPDFAPRHQLDGSKLTTLFAWDEAEFLQRTEGSAIRRIGHSRWLRNVAVALGNAVISAKDEPKMLRDALAHRSDDASPMVREHVRWALAQQPESVT